MTKTRPSREQFPAHFFTRFLPETRPVVVQRCEHPGCVARGEHKAPARHYREERQQAALNIINERAASHRWFCLDHVKEYNAAWDYYEGLDQREIEAAIRFDTVWNRPSWPFGRWGPKGRNRKSEAGNRKKSIFGEVENGAEKNSDDLLPVSEATAHAALAELGLTPPVDFAAVKKRYRELVKRHHPDVKGGEANDTIARLNGAFAVLKALYLRKKD